MRFAVLRVILLNQYYRPSEAPTALLLGDLGEELARQGHEVVAICSRREYEDPGRVYPARERIAGVEVHRTWSTGRGRASRRERTLDYATFLLGAARSLAVERDADVIVSLTTPPMLAFLGTLAAQLRGARSVFWVMDVYPDLAFSLGVLREKSMTGRLLRVLGSFPLRRSDAVIALGQSMADRLRASGAGSVRVVHNWVDGEAIRPCSLAQHGMRSAWGWDGRFVVMYSGNMGLAHEFETVLDAAERLRERSEILFAFCGDGPRRAEIEDAVRARNLPNVEVRPYVARADLGQSLTAANVHLVTLRPGVTDLLVPSKIYGVLAAGRPLLYVGPAEGETHAIVTDGKCGTSTRNGDPVALADAIGGYADDEVGRADSGRRARELFDRRFRPERALAELGALVAPAGWTRGEP